MKRNALLVEYSSSDEEEAASSSRERDKVTLKRKKLPSLSSKLVVVAPIDDPSAHQGRIRTTPHVDGQWAAHVYVNLKIKRHSGLYSILTEAIEAARVQIPALHDFWSQDTNKTPELHVSLSRPIFLRAYQRDELKRTVKALASTSSPFTVSFASFGALTNDEHTRAFLAVEIGAGHDNLSRLSSGLKPFLEQLRQKEYYASPRFHASIAWMLSTTAFSEDLIASLDERFQGRLTAKSVHYDADSVSLKIGKEVFNWSFKSSQQ